MIPVFIDINFVNCQYFLRTNQHTKAAPFTGFRLNRQSCCLQSLSFLLLYHFYTISNFPSKFPSSFIEELLSLFIFSHIWYLFPALLSYPLLPLRVNAVLPSNTDRFRHFSNRFHTISIFSFLLKPFFRFAMMVHYTRTQK